MLTYSFNKEMLAKNKDFEFYFGIWNLENVAFFDTSVLKNDSVVSCQQRANFFVASSVFDSVSSKQSLFSVNEDRNANLDALLFRGYILEPPLHSLSDKNKIHEYWKDSLCKRHNGVFSAVAIKDNGKTLEMTTDAFGIGSLYYRKLGSCVVFATSPRFLTCEGDRQDLVAWRCLMQSGFIPGNKSLSVEIKRVPPGTVLTFTPDKVSEQSWFDFTKLPEGNKSIESTSIGRVEDAFSTAMQRCLKLEAENRLLPLSSGYDSRRVLAYLLDEKEKFTAETVQVPDSKNRDVDAYFSAMMAIDFSFSHKTYKIPSPTEMHYSEVCRRFCLDFESSMHTWFLPLWEKPACSTLVLEGLCGDTLGHSGLKISKIGNNYKTSHKLIAEHLMSSTFDSVLNHKLWPNNEEVVANFIEVIDHLPETNNLIDLVMILHRARRAISISSQQFAKPGHIVVYPYMDLDYIYELLRYGPLERLQNSFQALCLKKYHGRIYNYFGSHNVTDKISVPILTSKKDKQRSLFDRDHHRLMTVTKGLKLEKKIRLKLAKNNLTFFINNNWWISPMFEYSKRKIQPPFLLNNKVL